MKFLVATAMALAAASAGAVPLVGLTTTNQLVLFDSGNTAAATTVAITGLAPGDRLVGIDLRPKDNLIYGVSASNRLYTVNRNTGMVSLVAALTGDAGFTGIDASLGYGIDFNPVADASTAVPAPASLRLVSTAGSNFAVNAATGVVGNTASFIGTGYSAVSYSNSTPLPTAAPASTALYYINSNGAGGNDTLSVAPGSFNAPAITVVGSLGIDVTQVNGFEVLADGTAFAALRETTALTSSLYSINLATGAATALGGPFATTLEGLTLAPVPEPQTYALMGLGLAAVGAAARRRKQRR